MKRLLYVLIPAIALAGVIAWRFSVKRQEQATQDKATQARKSALPSVVVVPATVRDIVHTFEAVGSVEAPFNVKIAAKVTGRLDYMPFREGDRVTQGQVLARINPSELEAQVRQQEAAVSEAMSRLAQARITRNATNVSVTTQIRQQQAAVKSAQANFNQVQQNYKEQVAGAKAAVTDAQGRVDNANSAIANASANIRSAQANLANVQVRYDRTYSLYKQGFIAAQDVDDARTQVDVQKSAVDVAGGQLEGAKAALKSAIAQRESAQGQESIVETKGRFDIEAARESLNQVKAGLDLARANTAQEPAYLQNIAALRSTVSVAQAQLRFAQAQFAGTSIHSSIDGYVTARFMDPGAIATAGEPILTVQAIRQVYVTTSAPEEISHSIYLGLPAEIAFDALPGRKFVGKITQINPAADPQSRQFVVRVTLDNPQNLIKPGMFARVRMVIERVRNAIVVPREAVQPDKTGSTIVVVDDRKVAHRRPVQTGAQDAVGIAITQGIQPGEKVIVLSMMPVRDGQAVRIGAEGPPPAEGRKQKAEGSR
jgi:HlyD family secretion protein